MKLKITLMKKLLSIILLTGIGMSCNEGKSPASVVANEAEATPTVISTKTEDVQDKSFTDLFKTINEVDIPESVFKLVGSDYTVITAGNESHYNSMVASWGGWGQLFNKPTTWCFLRANRYTLELIRAENTYTMSYFEDMHKDSFMGFGMKSGRDSEKMKESPLTPVQTPDGNMSYKEAKLIIECKLTEVTTVSPDDFLTEEGREFVTSAYEEAKEYHKIVFGEITNIWIRK